MHYYPLMSACHHTVSGLEVVAFSSHERIMEEGSTNPPPPPPTHLSFFSFFFFLSEQFVQITAIL